MSAMTPSSSCHGKEISMFFEKKLKKNLQVKIFVVPLQSQNKQSGGGEMVDTLL